MAPAHTRRREHPLPAPAVALALLAAAGVLSPAARAQDGPAPKVVPLFECKHHGCDCGPAVSGAELKKLLREVAAKPDEETRRALLSRGPRLMETLVAYFPTLPKPQQLVALREAAAFERFAHPLAKAAWRSEDPDLLQKAAELAFEVREPYILSRIAETGARPDRLRAIDGLRRIRGHLATHILVDLLEDPDKTIRLRAARAVRGRRDPEAAEMLLRLSHKDPEADVRSEAATSLIWIAPVPGGPGVRREATELLTSDRLPDELIPLLPDLLRVLDAASCRLLATRERHPAVQAAAIRALAAFAAAGDGRAQEDGLSVARDGLQSADTGVVRASLHLLGAVGTFHAAKILIERLRSRATPLQKDTLAALRKIGGAGVRPTYPAWRAWLDQRRPKDAAAGSSGPSRSP